MALSNIVLLCQVAGYVVSMILSLCIVVPMSLHQDEFRLVKFYLITNHNDYPCVIFKGDIACYFLLDYGKKQMDSSMSIGLRRPTAIIQFLLD